MVYKASLDTTAKILTAMVFAIFLVIGFFLIQDIKDSNGDITSVVAAVIGLLFFILLIGLCWIFAPQSYTLNETELIINRPVREPKIILSEIASVRVLDDKEIRWAIRTFGVGGVFGFYGKFFDSKIGSFTMYATQRRNKILLITNDKKKFVITPDDISLADALSKKISSK